MAADMVHPSHKMSVEYNIDKNTHCVVCVTCHSCPCERPMALLNQCDDISWVFGPATE